MNGLMMQQPLLISTLLTHAERHHGEQEIVSRRVEGDLHRYTYLDLAQRARRMANALAARQVRQGGLRRDDRPRAHARDDQDPEPDVVAMAACIAVRDPKWDERPLLVVAKQPSADVTREQLLAFYEGKIAKWWTPDDVVFVDAIPLGATGKMQKNKLREMFKDYKLPAAS
jgi:acyl-CoA synthetase (AMP-forming)/AMP-acid ligase II